MAELFNTFENISIDDKGRLSVPASFRKALPREAERTFMIIQGTDGCLFAYPRDQWVVFWRRLKKLSRSRENTRLIRRILGNLKETKLDGQGRITLTQPLKELLKVTTFVTLVGHGDYLEIWEPEAWRQRRASDDQSVSYDEDLYRAAGEIDRLKDEQE